MITQARRSKMIKRVGSALVADWLKDNRGKIGWQVAKLGFIPALQSPTGDRNIEFERALPKRFDRFDRAPRDRGSCSFAQCFSRHTDKGTRGPRENPLGSSMRAGARCACVTIRPTYSHARIRA